MPEDIKEILNHLIATPTQSQIQIDFDLGKKIFVLLISIYQSRNGVPRTVKEYVEARKNRVFKPHATSFAMEGNRIVTLVQEIPFQWGFRPGIRKDILDFLHLAKRCHRMLYEIALEEKYKAALQLDSDLAE